MNGARQSGRPNREGEAMSIGYRMWTAVIAAVLVASANSMSGQEAAGGLAALVTESRVKAALDAARAGEAQTIDQQIRFCEVPAPPFKETARGQLLHAVFQELGLQNVRVDRAGNVLGERHGASARPRLVVAAHLDTVFPEGTDVKVRREGNTLRGPGIGDNCRGLAVLVAVVRSLKGAGVQTPGSITFVANVGEEGLGDLRGMKTLFNETLKGQVDRFVSIDGPGLHVTHIAVGSHRYRMTFKGPGGHSFGAFGLPNPANALGRAVAKIAEIQVPNQPRTTFNVGRIGGGTSVNAIPAEAWMEVDMRSSDPSTLSALDARIQAAVDAGVAEENRRWKASGKITVTRELVGDRPAGSVATNAPIIQTVQAAARAVLGTPVPFSEGSTDANLPMSLNIPAVAIGGGGDGDDAHVVGESFDMQDSWKGTVNALLVTIALAQP
jgi:acetylornithine deacetylase/succinyl-diaminopimelate desuccinylase-like protein